MKTTRPSRPSAVRPVVVGAGAVLAAIGCGVNAVLVAVDWSPGRPAAFALAAAVLLLTVALSEVEVYRLRRLLADARNENAWLRDVRTERGAFAWMLDSHGAHLRQYPQPGVALQVGDRTVRNRVEVTGAKVSDPKTLAEIIDRSLRRKDDRGESTPASAFVLFAAVMGLVLLFLWNAGGVAPDDSTKVPTPSPQVSCTSTLDSLCDAPGGEGLPVTTSGGYR